MLCLSCLPVAGNEEPGPGTQVNVMNLIGLVGLVGYLMLSASGAFRNGQKQHEISFQVRLLACTHSGHLACLYTACRSVLSYRSRKVYIYIIGMCSRLELLWLATVADPTGPCSFKAASAYVLHMYYTCTTGADSAVGTLPAKSRPCLCAISSCRSSVHSCWLRARWHGWRWPTITSSR